MTLTTDKQQQPEASEKYMASSDRAVQAYIMRPESEGEIYSEVA